MTAFLITPFFFETFYTKLQLNNIYIYIFILSMDSNMRSFNHSQFGLLSDSNFSDRPGLFT